MHSSCIKKKHSLITSQLHSLTFNIETTESITYSNIGEEIWKTPIIEADLLFDRFINNSKKNYFSTTNSEDKTTFKSIITVHGTTKEVRRKVRHELFEEQLLPLCKDIFELIDDVQSPEEHAELQNLILDEFFRFFNNLVFSIQEAIRNPTTIMRDSTASLIDKQLYCARVLQSLRKLYIDLFLEIYTRLSLFGNGEDSFVSLMRKTKTQIANLKQKSKKATPLKEDMTTNHLLKFIEIENRFGSVYLEAFEDWINKQSEHFAKQIQHELDHDQQWNKPTRKELWQTFSNEKDGETFSLPFRTSYSVFHALHELSISIYSIGDFNIDKSVTDKLSEVTAYRVFSTYLHWLERKIEEAKTLQKEQIDELNTSKERLLENSTTTRTDKTQESSDLNKIEEIEIKVLKEGPIPTMEKMICEEGFLQILFDVRYLAHVFFGSQLTYEKLSLKPPSALDSNEKLFVKLGTLILDHIDPINWETFEKAFNISVLQCVNRNLLFTPNLCKTSLLPLTKDQTPLLVGYDSPLLVANMSPQQQLGISSSDNDAFFKLCKPESIPIHLLPIPKRELRMNYMSNNYNNSSHHINEHFQDSYVLTTSNHAASFVSEHGLPHEAGSKTDNTSSSETSAATVFGSFFSSLISAQNQQKTETEKETPSRGFAFTWF